MKTIFRKIISGLSKTRTHFRGALSGIFDGRKELNEDQMEMIEAALIQSDVSFEMAHDIALSIKDRGREIESEEDIYNLLKDEITKKLSSYDWENDMSEAEFDKPYVIMVVGVNGTGKTTTIGKLIHLHRRMGKSVLVAAADTYRAAAVEQLEIWAKRADAEIVKSKRGADPAAVAYDAIQAAKSRGKDVLIIDTAGRLHTSTNLMEELKKIRRVIGRDDPRIPHEVLLTIDANTGQNALKQASEFLDTVGVTGIVLAKLDGTAKGGIVLSIQEELKIPIKYVGVGESIEDLEPFEAEAFARSLFYENEDE